MAVDELFNITMNDMVKELHKRKAQIIDEFAKAYLAETELLPSDVELVTQQMPVVNGIIETVYFFRRKQNE